MQSETVQGVLLLDPHAGCAPTFWGSCSLWRPTGPAPLRGRYTMERQRLVPDSDVEELLQILDAMDICARDLTAGPWWTSPP